MSAKYVLLFLGILLFPYAGIFLSFPTILPSINLQDRSLEQNIAENAINVFFCPRNNCEKELLQLITTSKKSIHCALYDIDSELLLNALSNASLHVDVSLVLDYRNIPKKNYSYVTPVKRSGLMHNKFCVFDNKKVFSGSYNPTLRGSYYNNNNMIVIHNTDVAHIYENKFQTILGDSQNVNEPFVSQTVSVYFCPEHSCEEKLIEELSHAKKSVVFMQFSFTSKPVAMQLALLNENGVDVFGMLESAKQPLSSVKNFLIKQGIKILDDETPYNLHHKVFIIDNETVITGSYNPSKNANLRNDENLIIIRNKKIAEMFFSEFSFLSFIQERDVFEKTSEIYLVKVCPNPPGKDKGRENVVIYNGKNHSVDARGWKLRNGKNTMFLDFIIPPKRLLTITSHEGLFSLPNKAGHVSLYNLTERVNELSWDGFGKSVQDDTCVRRKIG